MSFRDVLEAEPGDVECIESSAGNDLSNSVPLSHVEV